MVQNDWDREFMTVQKTYFGHITQDKISDLDDEVHAIRMTKDKYDACLIGVEDCSKSTLDNYAETIKDLRYLEIIQEDYHSLDLSVNSYYIQRKPYEILYGSSSGFTTIVNFLSLMSITAYLSAVSLRRNESNEFDNIIISTKKGKYVSRKIRRNIVLFIAVMLLLVVEVFNILKVQKYYGSLTTLYNLSVLVNTIFKVDLPLFYYQVLNISIKILWMMSLVNLVYISERVRKNKSFLLIAFVGVWIVSVTIFKTITPNILNNPILLLLIVISLLVFNLSVYRQEYHDAKIRS